MTTTLCLNIISVLDYQIIDTYYLCLLACLNSLSISLKCFDWLRLVESTAFYIDLIGQTITDIKSFIILLIASFCLFGLPMMMLNFYSETGKRLF